MANEGREGALAAAAGLATALFGPGGTGRPSELLAAKAFMGFLEPAGVGILVVDSGGKVAYSNPVYRGYFGLPADYFESRPLFSDSIRAWAEAEGLAEGETAEILRDFAGRLASSRTVRFRGRCLRVQTLPLPGGGLLLLYVDITEAEELRRKSELDARLLSTVIESAPCFIAYLDRDLRFVFANSTYATQFGRPIGEIVGKEYRQLLAPEVAAEREPLFARCLAGETVYFKGRGPLPDGPVKDIHGLMAPVRDAAGESKGLVVVLVDDTASRRLERELEAKNRELEAMNRELEAMNEELKRLATTDSLSGALNRGAILSILDEEIRRASRYGHELAVVLFDLDHFKLVNDIHGHAAGDETIRRFSEICKRSFRGTDSFGRYGGEEFLAVLPESTVDGALDAAERARQAMAAERFSPTLVSPKESGDFAATASAGVASWEAGLDADQLLARADNALYRAKTRGRNRVEAHGRGETRRGGPEDLER